MSLSRRQFCALGISTAASFALPTLGAAAATSNTTKLPGEKRLALRNLHTNEFINVVYWAEGFYVEENVRALDHLLRDHRSDQTQVMDLRLFDSLERVGKLLGGKELHVISGYRSPQTNAKLRAQGQGIAKKSFHMEGRAIDIRAPGKSLAVALKAVKSVHSGGIGYYPKSSFIHLDTGKPRSW